jgi:hypothetical protein
MLGDEYSYCGPLHCSALSLTVERITSIFHFLLKVEAVVALGAHEILEYPVWVCKGVLNVRTAGTFVVL